MKKIQTSLNMIKLSRKSLILPQIRFKTTHHNFDNKVNKLFTLCFQPLDAINRRDLMTYFIKQF